MKIVYDPELNIIKNKPTIEIKNGTVFYGVIGEKGLRYLYLKVDDIFINLESDRVASRNFNNATIKNYEEVDAYIVVNEKP